MSKSKSAKWLVADFSLLVLCLILLLVDTLIVQDVLLALAALGGVFIFSIRVGRDIRTRRTQTTS